MCHPLEHCSWYMSKLKYAPSPFCNLALCISSLEFPFLFLHSLFQYHIHTSHWLGSFSNSSRGSSAGVAILRLVFIGFSQLLNRWSLLAIGNHRWWGIGVVCGQETNLGSQVSCGADISGSWRCGTQCSFSIPSDSDSPLELMIILLLSSTVSSEFLLEDPSSSLQ